MRAPAFWYGVPGAAPRWLAPLGWAYGMAGRLRFAAARPYRAGVPVVCVGNLVAGGAGKTPVALAVAAALGGDDVHFLSRGYGGRRRGPLEVVVGRHGPRDVGDEALLLARHHRTWVARDRGAGARAAEAAGARLLVMDDGFQNPSLVKDLSLVVVDGAVGFGNRRLIPAGPLREPLARGVARADAVVVLGEDRAGVAATVASLAAPRPVLAAHLAPAPSARALRGERLVAFAGIGRPEKFFATCRELGCDLVAGVAFPDHHLYRAEEIMRLVELAAERRATLVTTAKDAVRLPEGALTMVEVVPVEVVWAEPSALARLLAPLIARAGTAHVG